MAKFQKVHQKFKCIQRPKNSNKKDRSRNVVMRHKMAVNVFSFEYLYLILNTLFGVKPTNKKLI